MIAQYEIIETGRFRITVDDPDSEEGATSPWVDPDQVAVVTLHGEIFIGASPFFNGAIPFYRVYHLDEVEDTEVIQLGINP